MRLAIYGYGNLGRGVELAARDNPDMQLTGVFTRRDPSAVTTVTGAPVYPADTILEHGDEIDVVIICGGSATGLPAMTPELARHFCVVTASIPTPTFPFISRTSTRLRRRPGPRP